MKIPGKRIAVTLFVLVMLSLACGGIESATQARPVTQAPSGLSNLNTPLFAIVPFHYETEDVGDGWKQGWIALASVNTSGRMLDSLQVSSSVSANPITVETQEGKTYPGQLVEIPGNPSSMDLDGIDVNASSVLPMPPNLPYWTTRNQYTYSGYLRTRNQLARYWIRFRFATTAHPTRIRVQFAPSGIIANANPEFVIDLSSVSATPPTYQVRDVKPISDLQKVLVLDIPQKIKFQVDNKCLWQDFGEGGWYLYLPYSATNRNQLDQETVNLGFGYAVWYPYGAWIAKWVDFKLMLGPGQSKQDNIKLAEVSGRDPKPQYLILYEPIGTYGKYSSVSVFALQCGKS